MKIITFFLGMALAGVFFLASAEAIQFTVDQFPNMGITKIDNGPGSFTLIDTFGDSINITFGIAGMFNEDINSLRYSDNGHEFIHRFILDGDLATSGTPQYDLVCNSPVWVSGKSVTCGKLLLDFSTLEREYSEPIFSGEEIIGYAVKPIAFNVDISSVGSRALVYPRIRQKYIMESNQLKSIRSGDWIVLDPQYSTNNVTDNAILTNVTCESGSSYCHLNISDPSLVLYMPFDVANTSLGTTYDFSSNNIDGTVQYFMPSKMRYVESGVNGYAYNINSTNTVVNVIPAVVIPYTGKLNLKNYTLSIWVNLTNSVQNTHIFHSSFGSFNDITYGVDVDSGNLRFLYRNATAGCSGWYIISTSFAGYSNKWTNIVITYNDSIKQQKLYINGTLKASATNDCYPVMNTGYDAVIGGYYKSVGGSYFNGSFDELMIFNRTLSAAEVQQIFAGTYPRFAQNGTHTVFQRIGVGYDNEINVSINHTNQNGSNTNLSLYIRYVSGQTPSINMSNGQKTNFTIDTMEGTLNLSFIYYSKNGSWSPILYGNVSVEHVGCFPIGMFTGKSYPIGFTGNGNPFGITNNGTHFFVADDADNAVYIYNLTWNYTGRNFTTNPFNTNINTGMASNDTYIWIVDNADQLIYQYNMSGNYTGKNYNINRIDNSKGIADNGTYFFIVDYLIRTVFKYSKAGTFLEEIEMGETSYPFSIVANETNFWVTDITDDEVYEHNMSGNNSYTGRHFDTGDSGNNDPRGITSNDSYFWITDETDDRVYQYYNVVCEGAPGPPPECDGDEDCDFCEKCSGGSCVFQSDSEDTKGECALEECFTGFCDGAGGCDYETSGEQQCWVCSSCTGTVAGECVNMSYQSQDSEGVNTCYADCQYCDAGGQCIYQDGTDIFNDCDAIDCGTGNCDQAVSGCGYYDTLQRGCDICETCTGATSVNCIIQGDGSDEFNECGTVQCDAGAAIPYYWGWDTLECFFALDEPDGACDGASACHTAAYYCPGNGKDGSTTTVCDCVDAQIGCTGTTAGSCNNPVCVGGACWQRGVGLITIPIGCEMNVLIGNEEDI